MLLLTGASGIVGSAILRRLTPRGDPIRCLVRDPRRLGVERVRVQIALGELADPRSFRHALRGVDTVVHLAATIRDQRLGSIEELNGVATWRLVRAAERAGVKRFVFFSTIGASAHAGARFLRSKALAERAVAASDLDHAVLAPSLVYSPGDAWLTLLERLALLPAMPIAGPAQARSQPIWAEDVADCAVALLDGAGEPGRTRYELAGPDVLTYEQVVGLAVRSFGRRRPLVKLPHALARRTLGGVELLFGPAAFATWDEVELVEVAMTTPVGVADARRLGVEPKPMRAVLGAG